MDDFGMLARDFGFKPQGKAAPMSTSRANFVDAGERRPRYDDNNGEGSVFNDVFGGPPKYTSYNNSKSASTLEDLDYDSIFKNSSSGFNDVKNEKPSSSPVYDKPVYDEDIFDGLPGLKSKSTSSSVRFDDADVFRNNSPPQRSHHQSATPFDDLLGNLGRNSKSEAKNQKSSGGLDDLLAEFGLTGSAPSIRPHSEFANPPTTANSSKETFNVFDDPFSVLESTSKPAVSTPGLFADTLDDIGKASSSRKAEVVSSSNIAAVFDDIDPLEGFSKTVPTFPSETNHRMKDVSPLRTGSSTVKEQASSYSESIGRSSFRGPENDSQKNMSYKSFEESHLNVFDIPTVSSDSHGSVGQTPASYVNANDSAYHGDPSPTFEENTATSGKVWLTVSDFPLVTHPTIASPPSRPPPPRPEWAARSEAGFFSTSERKGSVYSSTGSFTQNSQSPRRTRTPTKSSVVNHVDDELDDFAMGRSRSNDNAYADVPYGEEVNSNSSAAASAAAMKEAMDKAQARFRYAKEVREREHGRTSRSKEATQQEKDEIPMQHDQDREFRENQEVLERQKRQKEEEEREQKRLERERLREREQARQAVERATREARERAVAESRERAATEARIKSERAAVQRAQAEARERAAVDARERAEKAAAEARERANAEAKERANAEARERVNAEAKEKEAREKTAAAEARRRAERIAVERVAAEARERAATEARERAAAARMSQQKNDNDLESFFSAGSRPTSAPRPRTTADPVDSFFQSKGGPDTRKTPSVSTSSSMRKASSTTNIVDDLSSIFGAAPSAGEFQEVEGETDERRRARLERQQRTHERTAKALAEKNQRDLQTQRDQEERHRISETLDIEIKRWAAGKEGNLRALLSTLQYVLWPECGWQPVSLTDLIMGASVKKAYRKATLCIHPDKVQQKGATLQQKFVAEKVFDLLKEAWNKFNSEELF